MADAAFFASTDARPLSELLADAEPLSIDERRVIVRGKGNYAAPPRAVEFRITARPTTINGHEHKPTTAADVRECDVTLDDVLQQALPEPQTKAHAARTLIAEALDDGEWHHVAPIRAQLAEVGISKSGTDRAATDLGVEHRRTQAFPSSTQWRLARAREGAVTEVTGVTGATAVSDPSRTADPGRSVHARGGSLADDEEQAFVDRVIREFDATVLDRPPEQAIVLDLRRRDAA